MSSATAFSVLFRFTCVPWVLCQTTAPLTAWAVTTPTADGAPPAMAKTMLVDLEFW